MTGPRFEHCELKLCNPTFDSPLVDVVNELEHLRTCNWAAAHLVDATVHGNDEAGDSDQMKEISNIEAAMRYVEQAMQAGAPLTETFIRDLHHIAVSTLQREGAGTA